MEYEDAIYARPYGIYFRPKVVYNKATQLYVLWVNHLPDAATPLQAYGEAGYRRRAMDAGMNKFLTKPVSSDDLAQLMA